MNRKVLRRMTLPLIAACLALADCSNNTTNTTPAPTTAFAVMRFTTTTGVLDTTFAGGGIAITHIDLALFDFAVAIAVQPGDNKILAAGSSGLAGQGVIALVRYNPDGTLDTTGFGTTGTGGVVRTPTPASWTSASASAIAVQPNNQIVVAALAFNASTGTTGIVLLRYNATGTIDTSFGTNGLAILSIGSGFAGDTCGLALQPDGKAVVVGASSDGKIILARYDTTGALDLAFGDSNSGITTTNLGVPTGDTKIGLSPAIGLQSGGQIVVASSVGQQPAVNQVVLRYGTNGALDTAFGGVAGGIVTTDINNGSINFANAIALQSDDKIVVAGHANVNFNNDTSDISLVRYKADGTLDNTFGAANSGITTTSLGGFDNAFSVALQTPLAVPTNILVSGNTGSGGVSRAFVLRYDSTGAPDLAFGSGGATIAPVVGPSNFASGNAVVMQTNVGIVVAGYD